MVGLLSKKGQSAALNRLAIYIVPLLVLVVFLITVNPQILDFWQELDLESDEQRCKAFSSSKVDFTISEVPVFCTNSFTNSEVCSGGTESDSCNIPDEISQYICGVTSGDEREELGFDREELSNQIGESVLEDNCEQEEGECTCIQQAYLAQREEYQELIGAIGSSGGHTLGDLTGGGIEQEESTLQQIIDFVSPFITQREEAGTYSGSRNYLLPENLGSEFQITYQRLDEAGLLPYLEQIAQEYQVDPTVLFFIIHKESTGRPNLISSTGCAGLTQFCDGTARSIFPQIEELGDNAIIHDLDHCRGNGGVFNEARCPNEASDSRFDPIYAIEAMAIHHVGDLRQSDNNLYVAIAGYNGGTGNFVQCNDRQGRDASIQCICSVTVGANGRPLTNGRQACDYVTRISAWVEEYSIYDERISGDEGQYTPTDGVYSNSGAIPPTLASITRPREIHENNVGLSEYLSYGNPRTRIYGLAEDLERILALSAQEVGVRVMVSSGGQSTSNRVGSTRHDFGNAADIDLYLGNQRLTISHPKYLQFVEAAFRNGVRSGSMGPNYMGSGRMHLDITTGCSFYGWSRDNEVTTTPPYASFVQAAKGGISQRGGSVVDCGSCGSSCSSTTS